jgi:peptide deformylase
MILKVLIYPNPILKQKSVDVENFDQKLHELLDNMYETMIEKNGIGLAAIQVGVAQNVLILNLPVGEDEEQSKDTTLELINPVIIKKEGSKSYQEGCLSIPEYYDDVIRAANVTLTYHDRYGETKSLDAKELLSVAIQHEMDHLDGNLFVEKLSMLKRKKFEKEWKKKNREHKKF